MVQCRCGACHKQAGNPGVHAHVAAQLLGSRETQPVHEVPFASVACQAWHLPPRVISRRSRLTASHQTASTQAVPEASLHQLLHCANCMAGMGGGQAPVERLSAGMVQVAAVPRTPCLHVHSQGRLLQRAWMCGRKQSPERQPAGGALQVEARERDLIYAQPPHRSSLCARFLKHCDTQ